MGCEDPAQPGESLQTSSVFGSFFGGGFECSTFIRRSGQRMDFVAATAHDRYAIKDYQRLHQQGLRVAREGIRWHLAEPSRGSYDFSSVLPIVRAARATGTQVIWDLCHFGWPDHIDLFKPDFVSALSDFAAAFARWLSNELNGQLCFVPINEISFFSWASGDEGSMYPFVTGRGFELKVQLVRAAISAMDAIWSQVPSARFLHVDPIIHVIADPRRPGDKEAAEAYRLSQFQAFDMLSGRLWPELGGAEKYLDIVGVNFYPHNQWFYNLRGLRRVGKFRPISRRHEFYRPFNEMLAEIYHKYSKPVFIAETGSEGRIRAGWLRYVCQQTQLALEQGVPVQGICLYPILNHPGWVDDRHCPNGLWDYPDSEGNRSIYKPLAEELSRWRRIFGEVGFQETRKTTKPRGKRKPVEIK